jgi:4-amino-4-deoxy-L-arabinose transferase-like glycosyltransferase
VRFIKKYYLEILIFAGITLIYFAFRLPNLTLQPIFADEAIYIRWAQVMKSEPTLRFLPVSDGKTPLFMWIMIPLFKIFEDPLFAGRILSVFSGFGTLLGIFILGWRFFNLRVGLIGAFLIAITPYFVFFDRMALVDSMLAAFSVWSLIIALFLVKFPRIDLAMLLGYILGGGLLTKPPGFFSVLTVPATLAIFNWKDKHRQNKFLKLFGLWVIAITITFGIYNILRLGPGFNSLNSRNQDYVFSPTDLIGRPLDPFIPHLRDIADWFPRLLTPPVLVLIVAGVLFTLLGIFRAFKLREMKLEDKYALTILFWSLVPMAIEMALLKTFTARYILFTIPPLIVLASWVLDSFIINLKFKMLHSFALATLFLIPLAALFNFYLLTNPSKTALPANERRGYLEDWTAGYGLKDIANFLEEQSKKGLIVVGTEGSFGTLPDGLQIYLDKNRQVVVIGGKATISAQLRDAAKDHETFFVANRSRYRYFAENIQLIKEYPKVCGIGKDQDSILLFKVLPLNDASSSAKREN